MQQQLSDNDILERLEQSPTVRGFFVSAVDILTQGIDLLIQRVFLKDDFAVQSVVGPLLGEQGPLADVHVRLKLLLGLGVLSNKTFQDIDAILKLSQQLNREVDEHQFTSFPLLQRLEQIPSMTMVSQQAQHQLNLPNMDDSLKAMQKERQTQVLISALSLTLVQLYQELNIESPL